ncbi:hypothetical protein EYC84_001919 [Monilinia fructicola]|uniref:Uncharacterized protein n=1 Tax=Monilinia fructicola TaxID=38448 RepID=A0A5M9JV36_MONFR|nr:hypothetical protein EYC84_001919 [Monilinia fructicola]
MCWMLKIIYAPRRALLNTSLSLMKGITLSLPNCQRYARYNMEFAGYIHAKIDIFFPCRQTLIYIFSSIASIFITTPLLLSVFPYPFLLLLPNSIITSTIRFCVL